MDNVRTNEQIEREELGRLIGEGVGFSVTYTIVKRFLWKRKYEQVTENFKIEEPTLATLDRMSVIWLSLGIDESRFTENGEGVLMYAKELTARHTRDMARMVAIAVLGEKYESMGNRELNRLTDVFFKSIKPSQMIRIVNAITAVSNLADFTSSMRLTSASRTSQKIVNPIE